MSNIDKLRDKVAKLLRQAEDVAGTPEEGVFQAKAFELMAKYGISESAVDAARQGLDAADLRDAEQWIVKIEGKYASAQMMLLHNLATALHGKTVYSKNAYQKTLHMYVYAVPIHLDRIKMLWGILQPQMMRLVDTIRPDYDYRGTKSHYNYETHTYERVRTSGAGHLKSYRRSWIAGFGQAVGERLRTQENKALVEASESGALVLFKGDEDRASQALAMNHGRLSRGSSTRINGAGYAHGQRDGRNASFAHSLSR